jgi:hypothetical protein
MDFNTTVSLSSLALAVIAAGLSTAVAVRQSRIMHHNNLLPVLIEMFGEFRSADFRERMRYIQEELWDEFPPDSSGTSDLPPAIRDRVAGVTSFFNSLGVLVANGVVDELVPSAYMGGSILRTWLKFSPYVYNERALRNDENYYLFFENLAFTVHLTPPPKLNKRLNLKTMPEDWSIARPDLNSLLDARRSGNGA